MPNPSPFTSVLVSHFASQANSSTEIPVGMAEGALSRASSRGVDATKTGEVSLPTGLCRLPRHAKTGRSLVRPPRERNESADSALDSFSFSNRKDRQKGQSQPLLKTPNRPRIVGFAEGVRHRCATPDEQVMDRDAEGVAGGCDAI